jgi:hypothetical protein
MALQGLKKRRDLMNKLALFVVLFVLWGFVTPATAVITTTYSFECITTNDPSGQSCLSGESALFVDVSSTSDASQVLFTFRNEPTSGAYDSFYIDGVYFYDGVLLKIASLVDADDGSGGDPDVDFSEGANPGQLPGLDLDAYKLVIGYTLDVNEAADSNPSRTINGVHEGEWLGVVYELRGSASYADVINGLNDGTIVIGLKVQGFGPYSESFVNGESLPVPGAVVLSAIGVAGIAWLRRRRM